MSTSDVITKAALELFYRQGFHASGVEQLSQHAGVTKKTLYRHFSSKEHLVEAALQRRHNDFLLQMQEAVEAAPTQKKPQAYIEFIIAWTQSADFHGCAFINAAAEYSAPSDPAHLLAREHKSQVQAYLQGLCSEADFYQPASVAMQLFVIGEGLIVSSQVCGVTTEVISATRDLVALLCGSASGK